MSSYLLRSIPPELWDEVRARATRDGIPMRQVLLFLLRAYADGQLDLGVTVPKPEVVS
jgi:hypothetical protein